MTFELTYFLILVSIPVLLVAAYSIRVLLKGPAHYDRVDRQGGSKFLSKGMMEMAYWALQPFARLLVFFGVTPNQISWGSVCLGFLAGACLVFGHFGFGAGLTILSGLLDTLDGMVARMTGRASDAGEILDSAMDRYVEFFFLGGLIIYYHDILPLMILAMAALLGSFMVSYSSAMARAEKIKIPAAKWSMRRPERIFYLVLGAALSPVTIPWLETIREYPVPIGHPMVISLGLVAVFANFCAIEQFWLAMKGIRLREALESLESKEEAATDAEEHPHRIPRAP